MVQTLIHKQIVSNVDKVAAWFREKRQYVDVPIYSSYDIRDSGFKVTNVDANIFPAGFNNICRVDREQAGSILRRYLERHYEAGVKRILLLTEEHTQNPYYWDNVLALNTILRDAGVEVRIAVPRVAASGTTVLMKSASGGDVPVSGVAIHDGQVHADGFSPDLVVSNNDFSEFYAEWGTTLSNAMNPPRELGWYQRKKSNYFKCFNELATEFAQVINVDPWLLTVETELFAHFDMADEVSREQLAQRVQAMLDRIREQYRRHGIDRDPFVFVKNNAGTYGLAVMRIGSADEIRALNYKSRKKMKAAKGGRDVEEVIIQEGVPSITTVEGGVTAEPTIYLLGCQLAGGFLRTHKDKDPTESLNSPGAVYKRMCVADLRVSVEGHPMENVYGWLAKLGVLAVGFEASLMHVEFKNYTRWPANPELQGFCP